MKHNFHILFAIAAIFSFLLSIILCIVAALKNEDDTGILTKGAGKLLVQSIICALLWAVT